MNKSQKQTIICFNKRTFKCGKCTFVPALKLSIIMYVAIMIYCRDGSDLSMIKDLKDDEGKLVLSGASDDDCRTIRRVCEAVSTRAARLAAAGVIALVRKVCQVLSFKLYYLHVKYVLKDMQVIQLKT